ncbi:UNVERIFIED_CONTAM: hypothetical protein FKN15_029086 [Acipenser sinensis]
MGNSSTTIVTNNGTINAKSFHTKSATTTVANGSRDNLCAYYSTREINLNEKIKLPSLSLPSTKAIHFTPDENYFITVVIEDNASAKPIIENFQLAPNKSFIVTASHKIVLRKSSHDHEWIDDDGNNHNTA